MNLRPMILLALVACGNTERFRYGSSNQVQRHNVDGPIAVPTYPIGRCGSVSITGAIDAQGTDIRFAFEPTTPPADGCCEAYGWIQHVARGDRWTFDNGAGATSDPYANPQGNPASGDRWNPNPWYGDEAYPRPQTTITDHPGGDEAFITELVCVESGSVVFQYRWGQLRDAGSTQWRFIGGEGQNLTINL